MGIIDKTIRENLQTENPRIPTFYLLPKIHIPSNAGRPIVNSIGSVTEKISALETNFLSMYPTPPSISLRFTDNIFVIWKYGEQQLKRFLEALNHYHPTINLPTS